MADSYEIETLENTNKASKGRYPCGAVLFSGVPLIVDSRQIYNHLLTTSSELKSQAMPTWSKACMK